MTYDQLEAWALNAAQALQEVCDEAQTKSRNPYGTDQRNDLRALIAELDSTVSS